MTDSTPPPPPSLDDAEKLIEFYNNMVHNMPAITRIASAYKTAQETTIPLLQDNIKTLSAENSRLRASICVDQWTRQSYGIAEAVNTNFRPDAEAIQDGDELKTLCRETSVIVAGLGTVGISTWIEGSNYGWVCLKHILGANGDFGESFDAEDEGMECTKGCREHCIKVKTEEGAIRLKVKLVKLQG